ncbi:hypothetical protein FD754_004856 [Muntiacus muntjak]|uniref:Ribonuclease P protein subunit p20 n=1 Tax=Muntiacus muntjak TaxID=9888 RepID=A0A5N3WFY8_MUNMU|nr:hypothetical protein FD754_004856 [Muntiacus muntjak]
MAENGEPVGVVKAEPDPVEYALWDQLPHCLLWRPGDIYIHRKTGFMNVCTEIYIHHLGLPINCAIQFASQLQASSFRSLHKAAKPLLQIRNNSAVHIHVFRVTLKKLK